MKVVPITLQQAKTFVAQHHRHSIPPVGWRFGVGLVNGTDELIGVGVASRPVARMLNDGTTLEITRVCVRGEKNANSMLYGSLCRAAKALGWCRVVTYTLEHESGSSLRAAGFVQDGVTKPSGWARPSRPEYEADLFGSRRPPPENRIRWVRQLATEP